LHFKSTLFEAKFEKFIKESYEKHKEEINDEDESPTLNSQWMKKAYNLYFTEDSSEVNFLDFEIYN
jgi:hypothetical protein